ncbi:hypothetical protein N8772_00780 [Rickettsiales bacterium]|nr:hypothetical protein [Rickettsiales bacterium]MDB2550439.1 hypothetical protein [Rickettsiales bacterium]
MPREGKKKETILDILAKLELDKLTVIKENIDNARTETVGGGIKITMSNKSSFTIPVGELVAVKKFLRVKINSLQEVPSDSDEDDIPLIPEQIQKIIEDRQRYKANADPGRPPPMPSKKPSAPSSTSRPSNKMSL